MEKLKEKINENNKTLNTIILIIFICISLFVGYHHEPWVDEAQAWLIARDATVHDIIFKLARYEGSPVMWQLILKVLISFKLQYKYYFVISTFFSSIGIYIILFKVKINNVYKILLPFTYFIGFQYTIIARNYSLLLPILAVIAMLFEERKNKVYLYNFFVLLLSFVSLHSALLSGVLYSYQLIEVLKGIEKKEDIFKYKKEIISIIVISLGYLFILFTLVPPPDIYINLAILGKGKPNVLLLFIFFCVKISEAFILKFEHYQIFGIISIIFVFALLISILKSNKKKILFLSIFVSEVIFLGLIRISNHHIGIIFYSFIFSTYLVKDEITRKGKKVFFVLFTVVLIIQSIWYFDSIRAEISTDFSAGKRVAEYIKTIDYKNKKIYGTGYYVESILPYFEENIFTGERGEKTYYIWSSNNPDWVKASDEKYLYSDEDLNDYDIVILDDQSYGKERGYTTLIDKFKENENYKETHHFKSKIIFKDAKKGNSSEGTEGFFVFERIK